MNKIEILRAARKLIKSEGASVICFAIDYVIAGKSQESISHADELGAWIGNMLGDSAYYSQWLRLHHPAFVDALPVINGIKDFRPGRLQWIDWMISELEKEAL